MSLFVRMLGACAVALFVGIELYVDLSSEAPSSAMRWWDAEYTLWILTGLGILIAARLGAAGKNASLIFIFWFIGIIVLSLPILVALATAWLHIDVFDAGCGSIKMTDFTWFVIDNLAKGGLFDLMESYHLNVYRCPPKSSFAVSTITFAIRAFSEYLVIWAILRAWWYWVGHFWDRWRGKEVAA